MQLHFAILSALVAAQSCTAMWSVTLVEEDKSAAVCNGTAGTSRTYSAEDNDSACITPSTLSGMASCVQHNADGSTSECVAKEFQAKSAISSSSCLIYFGPDCTDGYVKSDYEGPCMTVEPDDGTFQSFRCDTDNVHS